VPLTVYSLTKVYRKNVNFIYGIVEVEEGFRVYCNITEDVEIGDKVKINVNVLIDSPVENLKIIKINIELFRVIVPLMLYAIIFNAISF